VDESRGIALADALNQGDRVEVRRRFDAAWARGFEVAEISESGVRVKRLSDGEVLPVAFDPDDIRKERKRNDFWWM